MEDVADPLRTIPEVAGQISVSVDTVYRMIRQGKFRPVRLLSGRVRGLLRIPQSQIDALAAKTPNQLPEPPIVTMRRRKRTSFGKLAPF
jgi:excisionase family DNA binding protein